MNRWLIGARLRTLPASVVPVAVGTAVAVGRVDLIWWRVAAAGLVSVALQVATNYQNDYADGVRGTDDARVGPVRLVASGLASASAVRRASLTAGLVAGLAGLALAVAVGPELLAVGVASLAAGYLYTGGPRPYGYAGFGEVFVFIFFGLVATVGAAYVQTEQVSALSLGASVPVGFLATSLLVVNNLRDLPTDAASGKMTLAVRWGDAATRTLYMGLLVGAFVAVPLLALARPWALLAFGAIPLAIGPIRQVGREGPREALVATLADTARLQIGYGVLLTLGMVISG